MKFLASTTEHHFQWLLYRKVKFHNERRKKALQKRGYEFWPIQKFKKLRNLEDHINFEWKKDTHVKQLCKKNDEILTITTLKEDQKNKYNRKRKNDAVEDKDLNIPRKRRKLSIN